MSDDENKQQIIARIIALQKKFIARQRDGGDGDGATGDGDGAAGADDEDLRAYKEEHARLATRLVDLAHAEQGTAR